MATYKKNNLIYHPTKVLFLDDNQTFLDSLILALGHDFNLTTATTPETAERLVRGNESNPLLGVYKQVDELQHDSLTGQQIDIDIKQLYKIPFKQRRFEVISVVVLDYQMPTIDGLSFCEKIKDTNVFKVLLTGQADNDIAIAAFNAGHIDAFISKSDNQLTEKLKSVITALQEKFFQQYTSILIESVAGHIKFLSKSNLYQKVVNDIAQSSQAVEWYLIDEFGSLLFLDAQGSPTWLIIRSDDEMKQHAILLEQIGLKQSSVDQVIDRKQLLFLLSETDYHKKAQEWEQHLFPCSPLENNYYFSHISDKTANSFEWQALSPLAHFCAESR